jgi:hypothetical protein
MYPSKIQWPVASGQWPVNQVFRSALAGATFINSGKASEDFDHWLLTTGY